MSEGEYTKHNFIPPTPLDGHMIEHVIPWIVIRDSKCKWECISDALSEMCRKLDEAGADPSNMQIYVQDELSPAAKHFAIVCPARTPIKGRV